MSMETTRVLAGPMQNVLFSYRGFIASSVDGAPIRGGLTSVVAEASLDGAAYSATGVTIAEEGVSGWFNVTIGATQMAATFGTLRITVSNTNAEIFYLDFRTDGVRLRGYGPPRDLNDAYAGDECEMTGILCPASALKEVDGYRVIREWQGGIDGPRRESGPGSI